MTIELSRYFAPANGRVPAPVDGGAIARAGGYRARATGQLAAGMERRAAWVGKVGASEIRFHEGAIQAEREVQASMRGLTNSIERLAVDMGAADRDRLRREQKLHEANWQIEQASGFSREALEELQRRGSTAAPREPGFARDYDRWLEERINSRLSPEAGTQPMAPDGRALIGEEARLELRGKLVSVRVNLFGKAAEVESAATEQRAFENLSLAANDLAFAARQNDTGKLAGLLAAVDGAAEPYDGQVPYAPLDRWRMEAKKDVIVAHVGGLLDRGQFAMADEIIESETFAGLIKPELRERMAGQLRRQVDQARAVQHAAGKQHVAEVIEVLNAGERPRQADLSTALAYSRNFADLDGPLADAIRLNRLTGELRQRSPAEIQATVNTLRGAPEKSVQTVRALTAAEKLLAQAREELPRDPLSWAARGGVVTLAPWDGGSPATVAARVKAAQKASVVYGVLAPPLTDEEIAEVANGWKRGGADDRLALLSGIEGWGMPRPMRDELLGRLGEKDGMLGLAADLTRRDALTARRVLEGDEFLSKPENRKLRPAAPAADPVFRDYIGDALIADQSGAARSAIRAAADAHYVGALQAKGGDFGDFDADEYERSLEAVAGKIVKHNGGRLFLPPRADEREFDRRLDALTEERLFLSGPQGEMRGPHRATARGLVPLSAAEVRDARLVTVGPGRYFIAYETGGSWFSDGDLRYAVDGDGSPYELDLSAPAPARR